jgi:DNA-binding MarR family transcriptional regulator
MDPESTARKIEPLSPSQHIATGLHKISLAIRSHTWQKAGQHGLTPTQAQILILLETRETQGAKTTISDAAEALAVTIATASDATAALRAKHLVAKQRGARDARTVFLHLTGQGKRAARRAALWSDFLFEAAQALSPEEQAVFLRALIKMIRHLQEHGQIPVSRMCVTCRFFRPNVHADPERPHHCDFVDAPFGDRHLRLECPDHEAAPRWQATAKLELYTPNQRQEGGKS